jgi:hypothetical protein
MLKAQQNTFSMISLGYKNRQSDNKGTITTWRHVSLVDRYRCLEGTSCVHPHRRVLQLRGEKRPRSITFSRKSCRLWDNVEKRCTARQATNDNTIRRMRFACWITMATDTQSEYVLLIGFPRQELLSERASMLRFTYVTCLALKIMTIHSFETSATVYQSTPRDMSEDMYLQVAFCLISTLGGDK